MHGLSFVAKGHADLVVKRFRELLNKVLEGDVPRIIEKSSKRSRFSSLKPNDADSHKRSALVLALGESTASSDVINALALAVMKDPCTCVRRDATEAFGHVVSKVASKKHQILGVKLMCVTLFDDCDTLRMVAAAALRHFQI